uniref:Uncharacterized protein n=1 Tax=Sus scrofa TaxID=9823 RepID=A0A4X1T331_PIG
MQEIIASVDHIKFDLEIAVEQQLGAQPLPFPGMDKSGAAVCEFFLKAACGKGKRPLAPDIPPGQPSTSPCPADTQALGSLLARLSADSGCPQMPLWSGQARDTVGGSARVCLPASFSLQSRAPRCPGAFSQGHRVSA